MVKQVKSNVNMEISDGSRSKVFHINQLQHQIQPKSEEVLDSDKQGTDIEHTIIQEVDNPTPVTRCYPERVRNPQIT